MSQAPALHSTETASIDLTDVGLFTHRLEHQAFKRLRDEDPVHFNPLADGQGFYALTRHEHIVEVARDMTHFISGKGTQIQDRRAEGHGAPSVHNADRPVHTELRKAGQKALRRGLIDTRKDRIRDVISQMIEAAPSNRPFEFVSQIAVKIPMIVFSDVLGVPANMQMQLVDWANTMSDVNASDADQADNRARLFAYFRQLAAEKRKNPAQDVASELVRAHVDGALMEDEYLDAFFMVLTVAGNETTRFLLAGGIEALCCNPDQLEQMRRDQDVSARRRAIEEMVRWVTPVIHMRRTTVEPTDLFGTAVPAGSKVVLYFASANRDERAFGDAADQFAVGRELNPHVGFGQGGHFCLGAYLARLETEIFFEELFKQITSIQLSQGLGQRLASHWFAGMQELWVEWH